MRRKIILAILIAIALVVAVGLGMFIANNFMTTGPEQPSSDQEVDKKPMIGVSIDSMVIERWHRDVDIIKARGEELGFHVEVVNAYEDSDKQVEQLRSLIKEGAKALLILPHDKDKLSDVVEEAKKQGVIVIAYDRLITDADVDAYVSFDNVAVGEAIASAMLTSVPEGNYVIINGAPSDNNSAMVHQGFYNVLQPSIDSGAITVIHETWAVNWREEFAYSAIARLMQDEQTIDGVLCANDLLAEGAISALAEYGMAGEIPVAGQDANISACQRIVEGKQLMTVYKPLKNLAEGSVELVNSLLEGRSLANQETINDGSYQVPYVKFDIIPVTVDNMRETVIKDFFHSEEDVYRQ